MPSSPIPAPPPRRHARSQYGYVSATSTDAITVTAFKTTGDVTDLTEVVPGHLTVIDSAALVVDRPIKSATRDFKLAGIPGAMYGKYEAFHAVFPRVDGGDGQLPGWPQALEEGMVVKDRAFCLLLRHKSVNNRAGAYAYVTLGRHAEVRILSQFERNSSRADRVSGCAGTAGKTWPGLASKNKFQGFSKRF